MAAITASSTPSVSKTIELLSPRELLGLKLLANSNAIIATSAFFYCQQHKEISLVNSNLCDITATLQDGSYSLSWGNKSTLWRIEEGPFRVIFYLNGGVEVVKEHHSVLKCAWPNRLIRMVGEEEFRQLKKIEIPCEEEFCPKPTLDMVKDGPVILISCKGSAFALGVGHRTDLDRLPAIFYIFSKNEQWHWAWHFTALEVPALVNVDGLPHRLKARDWITIAQILGNTHPELALFKEPSPS